MSNVILAYNLSFVYIPYSSVRSIVCSPACILLCLKCVLQHPGRKWMEAVNRSVFTVEKFTCAVCRARVQLLMIEDDVKIILPLRMGKINLDILVDEGEGYRYTQMSWGASVARFSSVAQLCPTLCDPMDCSIPGLPVHHQLPELAQTHVHRVGDAIQPSHPLSSPSPPALNLSQHQGLFK